MNRQSRETVNPRQDGLEFPKFYVVVFYFVQWLEVGGFVDIGGIVEHHSWNCLFTILDTRHRRKTNKTKTETKKMNKTTQFIKPGVCPCARVWLVVPASFNVSVV